MGPVKFDDLSKPAKDILEDDHQTSGFQFKAKQKTNWDGAVVTSTVDLFPPPAKGDAGGSSVKTPAKLSWKFPKPFGIDAFSVDKLEVSSMGSLSLRPLP